MPLLFFLILALPKGLPIPLPILSDKLAATSPTKNEGVQRIIIAAAYRVYAMSLTKSLSSFQLQLHRVPLLTANDTSVVVFKVVLLQLSVVLCLLLRQEIPDRGANATNLSL